MPKPSMIMWYSATTPRNSSRKVSERDREAELAGRERGAAEEAGCKQQVVSCESVAWLRGSAQSLWWAANACATSAVPVSTPVPAYTGCKSAGVPHLGKPRRMRRHTQPPNIIPAAT